MTPHEIMISDKTRIVVTGMGMVSPFGTGVEAFLGATRRGEGAIRDIEDFDVTACVCKTGARVPSMDMQKFDGSGNFRRAPRATQYTVIATDEALRQAGHENWGFASERVGVFLGTYRGMTEVSEQIWTKLIDSEPRFVPALLFQETVTNAVASAISIRWGFRGTNYAISSGNSSGFQVLHLAVEALREGRADAIVAGTFDLFTQANQHDMDDLGMLSATGSSRPFDNRRDGFVMGEGAAVVVLETLASAKARGANVLAEIAGLGRGLVAAMRKAMVKADVTADEIDYIGAAANSTDTLDRAERAAIELVFGDDAATVPVSSIKGMTGEAMAASDMFNLIACIGAVRDNVAPMNAGFDNADENCTLNLVRSEEMPRDIRLALANSYSFFGGNAGAALIRSCPN
jgi:3-oxoacyl-(acyl-carrier-protein) synthase